MSPGGVVDPQGHAPLGLGVVGTGAILLGPGLGQDGQICGVLLLGLLGGLLLLLLAGIGGGGCALRVLGLGLLGLGVGGAPGQSHRPVLVLGAGGDRVLGAAGHPYDTEQ